VIESFEAVACSDDLVTLEVERISHSGTDAIVVVHDQYAFLSTAG
jgi:hypothetical protein